MVRNDTDNRDGGDIESSERGDTASYEDREELGGKISGMVNFRVGS